jgi:hypothetical protein
MGGVAVDLERLGSDQVSLVGSCWRCFALTSLAILGHLPVSADQQLLAAGFGNWQREADLQVNEEGRTDHMGMSISVILPHR